MNTILNIISTGFLPILISTIILYGLIKKAPIYQLFTDGAKEGLQAACEMLPFILSIYIGIDVLTASGAMSALEKLVSPLFKLLNIPTELTPLILLRPVSGSGSFVITERIMMQSGPDSFIGRSACAMAGSCETIFYVIALYFGVTHVKKMRYTLLAGLIGYVVGVAASLFFCSII